MSEASDYLLFALSSRGSTSWRAFKELFYSLRLRDPSPKADENGAQSYELWQCVRSLQALGHCDFDFSAGGVVYVAPPVLARMPRGGTASAVLVGARTPNLLADLAAAASQSTASLAVQYGPRQGTGIPRRVTLESIEVSSLREIASSVRAAFEDQPAAWKIAHHSGSVSDYLQSLTWLPATDPAWHQIAFHPARLAFSGFYDSRDALRLTRAERFGRWEYSLWSDGQRTIADLDWARYAIASSRSQQLLAYDIRKSLLAAAAGAPIPMPLSRALALCSGSQPRRQRAPTIGFGIDESRRMCDLYEAVPLQLANAVFDKLGQKRHYVNTEF